MAEREIVSMPEWATRSPKNETDWGFLRSLGYEAQTDPGEFLTPQEVGYLEGLVLNLDRVTIAYNLREYVRHLRLFELNLCNNIRRKTGIKTDNKQTLLIGIVLAAARDILDLSSLPTGTLDTLSDQEALVLAANIKGLGDDKISVMTRIRPHNIKMIKYVTSEKAGLRLPALVAIGTSALKTRFIASKAISVSS